MKNQRKTKKGRSDTPSDISMKKGPQTNKQNSKNTKQFLTYTAIGIITLFLASAMVSLVLNSPSVQNLAMVMPPNMGNSMAAMMMQSASKPFVVPQRPPHPRPVSTYSAQSNIGVMQDASNGNKGPMFAHARSTEEVKNEQSNKRETQSGGDLISLDADFGMGATHSTMPQIRHEMQHQIYYYFDSSSQAFHLHDRFTTFPDKRLTASSSNFQRSLGLSGRYQPTLCSDGQTYGFSDLATLRNAIHELSDAYSDAVSRWQHYKAALSEYEQIKVHYHQYKASVSQSDNVALDVVIESPPPLPEHMLALLEIEPDPYVICPHVTLRALLGRHLPIHINAEDVQVVCDSCVIDTPGTHFTFGSHAKNILIKGLTLTGATESSVIFRENGADVSFEECYWVDNESVGMQGAVADVNSTSAVKFYRCEISDLKQKVTRPGIHGVPNTVASSLTLRG